MFINIDGVSVEDPIRIKEEASRGGGCPRPKWGREFFMKDTVVSMSMFEEVVWEYDRFKIPSTNTLNFQLIKSLLRQHSFLGGRYLLHSILVVNEGRRKKRCFILKVNYEKVYDSTSWNFLFYMMKWLRYDDKWISWINRCLSSITTLALVTRSSSFEFVVSELRLRDLLTPFLLRKRS